MLAPVLNRDFVLAHLELVQRDLAKVTKDAKKAPQEDLQEAADALDDALKREKAKSSGQEGYDDLDARRGEEPARLDDFVFVSHDPIVSIVQSALQQYFETTDEGTSLVEKTPPPDDGRRGQDGLPIVTDTTLRGCTTTRREDDGRRVFNSYSQIDPRWIASKIAEGIRFFRHRHAFKSQPAAPIKISNNARLVLVADWGSGLPRAKAVATQMRTYIDDAKQRNLDVHVIHLGDVYYSGWKNEYEKNFLSCWPVQPDEADVAKSWCLNGNHDMYSGGHAYFDFLLADSRFARQQQSSFFSLHNDNWEVLALDTAWEDSGLVDPQSNWIEDTVNNRSQKLMLLSHHQLFSAYEHGSPILRAKLDGLLNKRNVDVWFWGHEHRCVHYTEHDHVRQARLIGNGGVPVYMFHSKKAPYKAPAFYEYRKSLQRGLERWALFGFAVVDFDGPVAHVNYVDEFGKVFRSEDLA